MTWVFKILVRRGGKNTNPVCYCKKSRIASNLQEELHFLGSLLPLWLIIMPKECV